MHFDLVFGKESLGPIRGHLEVTIDMIRWIGGAEGQLGGSHNLPTTHVRLKFGKLLLGEQQQQQQQEAGGDHSSTMMRDFNTSSFAKRYGEIFRPIVVPGGHQTAKRMAEDGIDDNTRRFGVRLTRDHLFRILRREARNDPVMLAEIIDADAHICIGKCSIEFSQQHQQQQHQHQSSTLVQGFLPFFGRDGNKLGALRVVVDYVEYEYPIRSSFEMNEDAAETNPALPLWPSRTKGDSFHNNYSSPSFLLDNSALLPLSASPLFAPSQAALLDAARGEVDWPQFTPAAVKNFQKEQRQVEIATSTTSSIERGGGGGFLRDRKVTTTTTRNSSSAKPWDNAVDSLLDRLERMKQEVALAKAAVLDDEEEEDEGDEGEEEEEEEEQVEENSEHQIDHFARGKININKSIPHSRPTLSRRNVVATNDDSVFLSAAAHNVDETIEDEYEDDAASSDFLPVNESLMVGSLEEEEMLRAVFFNKGGPLRTAEKKVSSALSSPLSISNIPSSISNNSEMTLYVKVGKLRLLGARAALIPWGTPFQLEICIPLPSSSTSAGSLGTRSVFSVSATLDHTSIVNFDHSWSCPISNMQDAIWRRRDIRVSVATSSKRRQFVSLPNNQPIRKNATKAESKRDQADDVPLLARAQLPLCAVTDAKEQSWTGCLTLQSEIDESNKNDSGRSLSPSKQKSKASLSGFASLEMSFVLSSSPLSDDQQQLGMLHNNGINVVNNPSQTAHNNIPTSNQTVKQQAGSDCILVIDGLNPCSSIAGASDKMLEIQCRMVIPNQTSDSKLAVVCSPGVRTSALAVPSNARAQKSADSSRVALLFLEVWERSASNADSKASLLGLCRIVLPSASSVGDWIRLPLYGEGEKQLQPFKDLPAWHGKFDIQNLLTGTAWGKISLMVSFGNELQIRTAERQTKLIQTVQRVFRGHLGRIAAAQVRAGIRYRPTPSKRLVMDVSPDDNLDVMLSIEEILDLRPTAKRFAESSGYFIFVSYHFLDEKDAIATGTALFSSKKVSMHSRNQHQIKLGQLFGPSRPAVRFLLYGIFSESMRKGKTSSNNNNSKGSSFVGVDLAADEIPHLLATATLKSEELLSIIQSSSISQQSSSSPQQSGRMISLSLVSSTVDHRQQQQHPNLQTNVGTLKLLVQRAVASTITKSKPSRPGVRSSATFTTTKAQSCISDDTMWKKCIGLGRRAIVFSIKRACGLKNLGERVANSSPLRGGVLQDGLNCFVTLSLKPKSLQHSLASSRVVAHSWTPKFDFQTAVLVTMDHATCEAIHSGEAVLQLWHRDEPSDSLRSSTSSSITTVCDVLLGEAVVPLWGVLNSQNGINAWKSLFSESSPNGLAVGHIQVSVALRPVESEEEDGPDEFHKIIEQNRMESIAQAFDVVGRLAHAEESLVVVFDLVVEEIHIPPSESAVNLPNGSIWLQYRLCHAAPATSPVSPCSPGVSRVDMHFRLSHAVPADRQLAWWLREKTLDVDVLVSSSDSEDGETSSFFLGTAHIPLSALLTNSVRGSWDADVRRVTGSFPIIDCHESLLPARLRIAVGMSLRMREEATSRRDEWVDFDNSVDENAALNETEEYDQEIPSKGKSNLPTNQFKTAAKQLENRDQPLRASTASSAMMGWISPRSSFEGNNGGARSDNDHYDDEDGDFDLRMSRDAEETDSRCIIAVEKMSQFSLQHLPGRLVTVSLRGEDTSLENSHLLLSKERATSERNGSVARWSQAWEIDFSRRKSESIVVDLWIQRRDADGGPLWVGSAQVDCAPLWFGMDQIHGWYFVNDESEQTQALLQILVRPNNLAAFQSRSIPSQKFQPKSVENGLSSSIDRLQTPIKAKANGSGLFDITEASPSNWMPSSSVLSEASTTLEDESSLKSKLRRQLEELDEIQKKWQYPHHSDHENTVLSLGSPGAALTYSPTMGNVSTATPPPHPGSRSQRRLQMMDSDTRRIASIVMNSSAKNF